MFSRSKKNKSSHGFGAEKRQQEPSYLAPETRGWKREADRPYTASSYNSTAALNVPSYPEKSEFATVQLSQVSCATKSQPSSQHGALHSVSWPQQPRKLTTVSLPRADNSISGNTVRPSHSHRSSGSVSSTHSRDSAAMTTDRSRVRRERTFVGAECCVCEEPLEHTLRGERILQFSCGHVSHEACFYEYIKEIESQYCPACDSPLHLDTSRGGNVLDIEKITNLVRSATDRSTPTPTPPSSQPWDDQPAARPQSRNSNPRAGSSLGHNQQQQQHHHSGSTAHYPSSNPRESTMTRSTRDTRDSASHSERYTPRHTRSDSGATGAASSHGGYAETTQSGPRRAHDYDVQAMETSLGSPRHYSQHPIPIPTVTVRSEFPTINRSRQQQTLTCLITIEVPENKWRAQESEDLRLSSIANHPTMPLPQPPMGFPQVPSRMADDNNTLASPTGPPKKPRRYVPYEPREVLEAKTQNLLSRVESWHTLDPSKFGALRLYGPLKVAKDKILWQELECYLFTEILVCIRDRTPAGMVATPDTPLPPYSMKGSILLKRHLKSMTEAGDGDENILKLTLHVEELPEFYLKFASRNQLKLWQQALTELELDEESPLQSPDEYYPEQPDEDDWRRGSREQRHRASSVASSSWAGGAKSATTAATEYTAASGGAMARSPAVPPSVHVPIDVVVVVPISSSMQGVKINLVRDALRFMVHQLGDRDRMGLVTFGSGGGGVPMVGMTTKSWPGWGGVLNAIRPVGQKSHRADVVEGANVAMDLLMQRKYNNPVATIMLISDASTSDVDSVDFVVSRAEAAKISIHSFGLGMTHKPDTMIELSTRTKASYTYVKDWMMLRECLAGCLGSAQSLSHRNVKLKLKLPEGSPAKFHKISGALAVTKRAAGRDAEASLGDLRFGDKRDILVQLVIQPDTSSEEHLPQDPWETIVSGLEALGGPVDGEDQRAVSVEEVPLIQADVIWGDLLRDGTVMHMPRPSLLAITMLPPTSNPKTKSWQNTPPIPPHPQVVQRRMELLTSDMLTRALTLVSRGQHDRAHTLLNETRSILKGLGKGGLPPVPPGGGRSQPSTPHPGHDASPTSLTPERKHSPSPPASTRWGTGTGHGQKPSLTILASPPLPPPMTRRPSADALSQALMASPMSAAPPPGAKPGHGIDAATVAALDAELEAALEWIGHPAVFGRDSRKAVLQAIGVISSQRALTYRTPIEALWAGRVAGVRRLTERSREWRDEGGGEGGIMEEA